LADNKARLLIESPGKAETGDADPRKEPVADVLQGSPKKTVRIEFAKLGLPATTTYNMEGEAPSQAGDGDEQPDVSENGPDQPLPEDPSFRYEELGRIGKGSMGEVRRVRDRDLNRVVAMKVVRRSLMKNRRLLARFIAEAQATAQLSHPGVVPIHELGVLPDGRFYFTMKEVEGTTLREVIEILHGTGETDCGDEVWTLHRVMEAYRQVCNAAAYAHSRGVVHRDLKPDNVMVGPFGEVLVLDWGLAKVGAQEKLDSLMPEPVVTNRCGDDALSTMSGTVAGTPSYMPPEQARGEFSDLDPTADVYALGAILFEILVGEPPYGTMAAEEVIGLVLQGPPKLPTGQDSGLRPATASFSPDGASEPTKIPLELAALCERAMKREPADRFAHAGELAHEVGLWLEGARKRDQARIRVAEARALYPKVNICRQRAAKLRRDAARALVGIPRHAPASAKRPAWRLQDQSENQERDAAIMETQAVQLLHGAISLAPELTTAHDLLAEYYRLRHQRAEQHRHTALAARYEAMLRSHDTGRHTAYLKATGRITLLTSEPGAEVLAMRYLERGRTLVPVAPRVIGRTPLAGKWIPSGTSLLVLRKEGFADVRYPVHLGRLEHLDGVPPKGFGPEAIYLPRVDELGPGECYVPTGWFRCGGDGETTGPRRVWVDGFVIQRFPVSVQDYLVFLNALVRRGREQVALTHAPRRQVREGSVVGEPLLDRDRDGLFFLSEERRARLGWQVNWPITMIDWYGASAYAEWLASENRLGWRLPSELEWEKAARGVDARVHPWGDFVDPSFCNMRDSHPGDPSPSAMDSFPIDQSPYQVCGMAGNTKDFCLDVYQASGPRLRAGSRAVVQPPTRDEFEAPRTERGGSWRSSRRALRLALRNAALPWDRSPERGFRLARSIVETEEED
jgi:serine/threonine-protein kinase